MTRSIRARIAALLAAFVLACAGCASDPAAGDQTLLQRTLFAYHSALRWGTVEQAISMHDPETIAKRPISAFETERWRQFRVVGYRESLPVTVAPGRVQQRVELELVNVNTQGVRNLVDVQEWRYDVEDKKWWLVTGLPSLDAK